MLQLRLRWNCAEFAQLRIPTEKNLRLHKRMSESAPDIEIQLIFKFEPIASWRRVCSGSFEMKVVISLANAFSIPTIIRRESHWQRRVLRNDRY
jgi:hypothetical protein